MRVAAWTLTLYLAFTLGCKDVHTMRMVNEGMSPTLTEGDLLSLIDTRQADATEIRRWDIVAFRSPVSPGVAVKRVVGLPGEEITIQHNSILIDSNEIPLPVVFRSHGSHLLVAPLNVPSASPRQSVLGMDEIFVVGDNTAHSFDSRHFGPVPITDVVGVVVESNGHQLQLEF